MPIRPITTSCPARATRRSCLPPARTTAAFSRCIRARWRRRCRPRPRPAHRCSCASTRPATAWALPAASASRRMPIFWPSCIISSALRGVARTHGRNCHPDGARRTRLNSRHWPDVAALEFGRLIWCARRPDMLKAYWAYDFACPLPIEDVAARFNEAGPWQWQLRDSAVYGDYLNCRPLAGVRLRVHEYPQTGLACNRTVSDATQSEVDGVLQSLLR